MTFLTEKNMWLGKLHSGMSYSVVGLGSMLMNQQCILNKVSLNRNRDFHGGPVVKTPCFHCGGHGFHPWSGN